MWPIRYYEKLFGVYWCESILTEPYCSIWKHYLAVQCFKLAKWKCILQLVNIRWNVDQRAATRPLIKISFVHIWFCLFVVIAACEKASQESDGISYNATVYALIPDRAAVALTPTPLLECTLPRTCRYSTRRSSNRWSARTTFVRARATRGRWRRSIWSSASSPEMRETNHEKHWRSPIYSWKIVLTPWQPICQERSLWGRYSFQLFAVVLFTC